MRAVINQNQTTLFDLNKMGKPKSNISLHFNKAVGLIDLIPTYTKENTLLLMEILIFWSQKAYREENKEYCNTDIDGNQWYNIPFLFIEEMLDYKRANKRYVIIEMLKELVGIKVEYNFLGTDNTIDIQYRTGTASVLSQVDYLDVEKIKQNKKYANNIKYAFSPLFNSLIKRPKIFANIDLLLSKKLHSNSARQLYQHCKYTMQISKQNEGISELTFEELKKLSGKHDINLDFKIYNRDILKKDKERINQKTDINLEYEKKRGADRIVFSFKRKETTVGDSQNEPILFYDLEEVKEIDVEQVKKSHKVLTLEQQEVNELFIKYKIDSKIREEFFENYTCRRIRDNIKYAEEAFKIKQKSPTFSYIIKAIREDYAKFEETALMEDKKNDIMELWSILYSWEGVKKEAEFHYKHNYIGTTIYLYNQLLRATEEDFKGYYKFKEVREKFQSLQEFQEAVKTHTIEELKNIEERLSKIQEKYNLSLEDICQIRGYTKKDVFSKMGVSEGEFLKLKEILCK